MKRMLTRSAVVLCGLLLVAGCGGSGGGGENAPDVTAGTSASPTAEAPRTYTTDQLEAALPRTSQVPRAKSRSATCPGNAACETGAVAETLKLDQRDIAGQGRPESQFIDDFVSVGATARADDTAASAAMATTRRKARPYEGPFDIKPKSVSGSRYTPGEKGTGSVAKLTVDGWSGFVLTREQQFRPQKGDLTDESYEMVQLRLARGAVDMEVFVVVLADSLGTDGGARLARQLAEEYVQRLR